MIFKQLVIMSYAQNEIIMLLVSLTIPSKESFKTHQTIDTNTEFEGYFNIIVIKSTNSCLPVIYVKFQQKSVSMNPRNIFIFMVGKWKALQPEIDLTETLNKIAWLVEKGRPVGFRGQPAFFGFKLNLKKWTCMKWRNPKLLLSLKSLNTSQIPW